jgi:hypothetical protein
MPTVVPAMRAARQRHGEMSFRTLNEIHVPFALISMILVPVIILAGRGGYGDLRLLAATVSVALLAKDTSGPNGRAASLGRRPCHVPRKCQPRRLHPREAVLSRGAIFTTNICVAPRPRCGR